MKEYNFPAGGKIGKWISGETEVTVELTDEEAERLEFYGTQTDIYYSGFGNCEELKELYNRIYNIAVDQMTEEMREYGTEEEITELSADDPSWKIDDDYVCEVLFPWEFEDRLSDNCEL